jgi:hypothetical protein
MRWLALVGLVLATPWLMAGGYDKPHKLADGDLFPGLADTDDGKLFPKLQNKLNGLANYRVLVGGQPAALWMFDRMVRGANSRGAVTVYRASTDAWNDQICLARVVGPAGKRFRVNYQLHAMTKTPWIEYVRGDAADDDTDSARRSGYRILFLNRFNRNPANPAAPLVPDQGLSTYGFIPKAPGYVAPAGVMQTGTVCDCVPKGKTGIAIPKDSLANGSPGTCPKDATPFDVDTKDGDGGGGEM